jgi:pimeloyl-ACP methyl ester carboxylesterase
MLTTMLHMPHAFFMAPPRSTLPSQLSDNRTCVGYDLTDAALFAAREAIPLSSRYLASQASAFLPIFASSASAATTHAVVWIHGKGGDANTYYCSGSAAARSSSATLSVAPWFGNEQVTLEEWLGVERADGWRRRYGLSPLRSAKSTVVSIYWSTSRWLSGGNNSPDPARFTTSFDALDATVAWLRASHATSLERVGLVGFSAGAQLVSRWALFSPLAATDANVTTVVSDPSSYIYLDGRRPASACSPLQDTGPAHACTTFTAPDASVCPGYDNYKYGLADLSGSMLRAPSC